MIAKGEKIFVITRRLFEGDLRRHFVGEVQDATSTAVRVQGYSFVFDESTKQFVRHDDLRTRVLSLIDAGFVINILPREASIQDIRYKWDDKNRRLLTDEKTFKINVNEFTVDR